VLKPRALGHKSVLARDLFLDFLIGNARLEGLLLAGIGRRALASSIVITGAHLLIDILVL
jgi:hypothetical protein